MAEFTEYGKTYRLFRDIVVTEKIDGTNSGIHIEALLHQPGAEYTPDAESGEVVIGDMWYHVTAQSRKRLIYPGKATDNYGFAGWVRDNAEELVGLLGPGLHFGEWWGVGINRGYGLQRRNFSLFNTGKHAEVSVEIGGVPVKPVPVLYQGTFSEDTIRNELYNLEEQGSVAAPNYLNPEGVCVFHTQSRDTYKITLDNNDEGKWKING